jgi:hypothetical protein
LARFNLGRASVYNYLATLKVSRSITIEPAHKRFISVSALTKLSTFPTDERQAIWDNFLTLEKPTISALLSLCDPLRTTSPNEYFTPPELVALAKQMNNRQPFDLDPCSCEAANNIHTGLLARTIFSIEDSGLSKTWHGRVFLNPPYGTSSTGQSMQEVWLDYAISQYNAEHVTSCLILLTTAHAYGWFAKVIHKFLYRLFSIMTKGFNC